MPGTFFPPLRVSDPDMHYGTCVTHVPWCMPGSLTSGFLWSRRRGKRSRHSRRIRNAQFYVSGKRPMGKFLHYSAKELIRSSCLTRDIRGQEWFFFVFFCSFLFVFFVVVFSFVSDEKFPYGRVRCTLYMRFTERVIFVIGEIWAKLFCEDFANFSWWGWRTQFSFKGERPTWSSLLLLTY